MELHYWLGIKSRSYPIEVMCAYFGCSDRIQLNGPCSNTPQSAVLNRATDRAGAQSLSFLPVRVCARNAYYSKREDA